MHNGIAQVRIFAIDKKDIEAWGRQKLVEVLIKTSEGLEIFTPDKRRKQLHEEQLLHAEIPTNA